MAYVGTVGTVSSFQRRKYDVFYWEIKDFSKLSNEVDDYYVSPNFNFNGDKSHLSFYPNGRKPRTAGYMTIMYLFSPDKKKESYCVHLRLGLKTQDGSIQKWISKILFYSSFPLAALICRNELLKRKAELIPSDCLTFVLFLSEVVAPKIIRDVADQTENDHVEENGESGKKGGEKVVEDVAKLLASGDKSDATILVKDSEFKVHSCILSARTPVFAALFEHETLEKSTRKVNITDCDPDVFKEFLNYIYSGSVQNLTAENSLDLYRVSDKYLVKELKDVSRQYIRDYLCPETFCEAVQLAIKCNDEDLLQSAIDYFAKNMKVVVRSVEWQKYNKENPMEANEILIRSLGPL